MRRAWIVAGAGFGSALGCLLVGCVFITGSTSGYGPPPAEAGPEAEPGCSGDAAAEATLCFNFSCVSTADCNGAGGDGGAMFCCATPGLSPPHVVFACQPTSCMSASYQGCATSAECGDGGTCSMNPCTLNGIRVEVMTCGSSPCR